MSKNITGERIKLLREKRSMTAEVLGQKIGKDRATIYRYESGRINKIPFSVLVSLANALRTSVDYLTGETDNDNRKWVDVFENTGIYTALHNSTTNILDIDKRINLDDLYQLSEEEIDLLTCITKHPGVLENEDIAVIKKMFLTYVEMREKEHLNNDD